MKVKILKEAIVTLPVNKELLDIVSREYFLFFHAILVILNNRKAPNNKYYSKLIEAGRKRTFGANRKKKNNKNV